MKTNTTHYRQGDVLVVPVASIPKGLKKTKRVTLALGEATGHHHSVLDGNAVGFADDANGLAEYLSVESENGADLTHQEHETINLPKGDYRVIGQVEYTPERIQRVAD